MLIIDGVRAVFTLHNEVMCGSCALSCRLPCGRIFSFLQASMQMDVLILAGVHAVPQPATFQG